MPQEVDIGRRQLVFGTIAGVTMLAAEGALSQVEQAYAALDTAASFPDRRNRTSLTHSAPNDTPVTLGISQGKPVTVQDTPTSDATVVALQKRILQDQAKQLETPPPSWLGTNILPLLGSVAGIGTLIGGIWQFNRNQRIDRQKRDEDRFREAVLDLGKDETKLGGATTLRTFLQKEGRGYERFYQQIFDLSVGFLRLRKVDQNNPEPDPFYKEIIRVFCESAPLVRKMRHLQTLTQSDQGFSHFERRRVKSERGLSQRAFLKWILSFFMHPPWHLAETLSDVPNFENYQRKFFNASHIHLENADLVLVDLRLADLISANFSGANLISANFSGADLSRADLSEADLTRANPEEASFLVGTRMWDVKNYPDLEKRQKCIGKGADFNTPPPAPDTKGEKK